MSADQTALGFHAGGRLVGRDIGIAALCAAGFVLLVAVLAPDGLVNGDAAIHSRQVAEHAFGVRTTHLGYLLILAALELGLPAWTDRIFNLVHVLFGGGCLACVFLLGRQLGLRGLPLWVAVLLFGSSALMLEQFVHGEVYAAQLLFLLASFVLWLDERDLAAGAVFGIAVLVSASSALVGLAFLAVRVDVRAWLRFGLVAGALVVAVLAPVHDDYLFGPRGLLKATRSSLGLVGAVIKEGRESFIAFLAAWPLVALGLWRVARDRTFVWVLVGAWLPPLLLGERFGDVPVQLFLYALLCGVAGLGAAWLERARVRGSLALALGLGAAAPVLALLFLAPRFESLVGLGAMSVVVLTAGLLLAGAAAFFVPRHAAVIVVGSMLVVNAAWSLSRVLHANAQIVGYREAVLRLSSEQPDGVAVGAWSEGILLSHYLSLPLYGEHWIDADALGGARGPDAQREAASARARASAAGRRICLLGPEARRVFGVPASTASAGGAVHCLVDQETVGRR